MTMDLKLLYRKYPTRETCIKFLEKILWQGEPICPYCQSKNQSPLKSENRYHCNSCKTTYSVTVNTVFHKTKVDIQKWFALVWIYFNDTENKPLREIASEIEVTKDTVWLMNKKIRMSSFEEKEKLRKIILSL
jgi:transposase-like protein